MANYEAKGKDFLAKANKKLGGWSLFGNKYEDAAELLEQAANQFKLAKAWKDAAETYARLAEVHVKLDSKHESASSWTEAANAHKKAGATPDAVRCYMNAVGCFQDMGRLQMAARQLKTIAELNEEMGRKEDCMDFYQQAADLFDGEDSTSEANKCRLKVAHLSAEGGKYQAAIQIFEEVARASLDSNLLKYSAKGYFLNAGICHLAQGKLEDIGNALERYKDWDLTFETSRECKLLTDLLGAMEGGNADAFTGAVAEFDSMTRLDPWKTSLLLVAKRLIVNRELEDDEDLT